MLAALDAQPLWLSVQLAAVTTVLLLLVGTPLAWWLARDRSRWCGLVEVLVTMPLVLPPTVLGFYLLVLLGPSGPIGSIVEALGGPRLVFSFTGLVLGSCVFSLPFVVQPLRNAFAAIGARPLEVAATLRAPPLDAFCRVVVPMTRPAFVTAATLGFAHTLGEFGVVLMIGGNVPGATNVVSVAIYERVERLDYTDAHILAGVLLGFSFAVLSVVQLLNRRARARA